VLPWVDKEHTGPDPKAAGLRPCGEIDVSPVAPAAMHAALEAVGAETHKRHRLAELHPKGVFQIPAKGEHAGTWPLARRGA